MLRHLPNAITLLRLAAVPVLAWLAYAGEYQFFAYMLVACLLGDVIDGTLARLLRATTPFGAQLDSVADTALFFVAVAGTLVFHLDAVRAHALAFLLVPGVWLAENGAALVRYRRLSSFHTWLSRAAAVAMGAFVVTLFLRGLVPWLLTLAVGAVLLATLEEFVLLWMLPEWTPNVGGVYWVLRGRRISPVSTGDRGRESRGTAAGPRPR